MLTEHRFEKRKKKKTYGDRESALPLLSDPDATHSASRQARPENTGYAKYTQHIYKYTPHTRAIHKS